MILCGHHQILLSPVTWKDSILSLPSSDDFNLQLSLSERRVFHTALQVFKIVKKISPPYLHDTFAFAVDFTGRSGRNQL